LKIPLSVKTKRSACAAGANPADIPSASAAQAKPRDQFLPDLLDNVPSKQLRGIEPPSPGAISPHAKIVRCGTHSWQQGN
jgi:hypothetical protein